MNIKKYYIKGPILEVLLSENSNVINTITESKEKKQTEIIKSEETNKNREKSNVVITNIVKKHKNRVVVIDFWATWCGPCLKAIREVEQLKEEYAEKGVVFVYVTSDDSPSNVWITIKKNIPGDHYYLDNTTWNQIRNYYTFDRIPTYLFFDKKGNFVRLDETFKGVDDMAIMLDNLLEKDYGGKVE